MMEFLLLMALLRSVAQKAPELSLIICTIYIIANKLTPRLKSLITFLE